MLQKLLLAGTWNSCQNHIVSLVGPGVIGTQLEEKGFRLSYLDLKRRPFRSIFALIKMSLTEKPDIISCWMYHACLIGILSKCFHLKAKLHWNIRHSLSSDTHKKRSTSLTVFLCRVFSFLPQWIIYNSEKSRKAHEQFGFPARKSIVVPNGFLTSSVQRKNNSSPDRPLIIGHLGRFHPIKNQMALIEAFAKFIQEHPNTVLRLCGRGFNLQNPDVRSSLERLSLLNSVELKNETSEPEAFLADLDMFVLCSLEESFPNVLAEAMLNGCFCLSTDAGDCRDILGDDGILIKGKSAEDIYQGLKKAVNLPTSERQICAARGKERIAKHYSIEACAQRYKALLIK